MNLSSFDAIIIIFYIFSVLLLSYYYSRDREESTAGYFLANRSLGWFTVGMSLFATNISSEHFIGLAGSGASRGLAVAQFELIAIFLLILLGWIMAPMYRKSGVFTTPEFLEKYFDRSTRKLFSGLSIFTYIMTKILVTLFAGGLFFNILFGWSIFTSAVIIVLFTGLYSIIGGFTVVVKTQVFQGIVFLLGAILLTIFSLIEVGGISGLSQKLPADYFTLFKPVSDPDFPWTGIIFGAPIIAFWYWCTDQYMVQRVLAAKSINAARTGTLFAAFLKIFPLFVLVLPGLISVALFPQVRGDEAFPTLLASGIMPVGVKGFVVAGMLAAIMSSLASAFNSTATLVTIDFYKPSHPKASESNLVLVGRLTTIGIIFLVLSLIPFVKIISSHIYIFLQSTQAYISAPVAAIFIFGLTVKGIKAKSVFYALLVGEFFGLGRFLIEILVNAGLIKSEILISYVKINYLHFTILLFLGTAGVLVIFNYILQIGVNQSRSSSEILSQGQTLTGELLEGSFRLSKVKMNVFISGLILIIVFFLWTQFS